MISWERKHGFRNGVFAALVYEKKLSLPNENVKKTVLFVPVKQTKVRPGRRQDVDTFTTPSVSEIGSKRSAVLLVLETKDVLSVDKRL